MDYNKVSAIAAVGCFGLALATFGMTVWPGPQIKAEHSQVGMSQISPSDNGSKEEGKSVISKPNTDSGGVGGQKLIAVLLVAGFLFAGFSIYGVWRRPKSKLVLHSAMYGIGAFNDVSVIGKLSSAVRDGLVVPVDNNVVDGNDPARNQPKRLRVEYSYGNSTKRVVERPESQPGLPSVLVLPEECEFRGQGSKDWSALYLEENSERVKIQKEYARVANKVTELEHQLSEATKSDSSLRGRTIAKCDELKVFLKEYGPEPEMQHNVGTTDHDAIAQYMKTALPWRQKLQADFRLRFAETLARISDEIQVTTGERDMLLSNAITTAANSPNGEIKAIDQIIERLWAIALKLSNEK